MYKVIFTCCLLILASSAFANTTYTCGEKKPTSNSDTYRAPGGYLSCWNYGGSDKSSVSCQTTCSDNPCGLNTITYTCTLKDGSYIWVEKNNSNP